MLENINARIHFVRRINLETPARLQESHSLSTPPIARAACWRATATARPSCCAATWRSARKKPAVSIREGLGANLR